MSKAAVNMTFQGVYCPPYEGNNCAQTGLSSKGNFSNIATPVIPELQNKMMKTKKPVWLTWFSIHFVLLSLSACVTNTASKTNLAETNFTVGLTTSKDVVDVLGLPEKVIRSEDGSQKYLYPGAARLSGFVVGSPGGGASFQSPGTLDAAINDSLVRDGAVYTFDAMGVLQQESSPKTRNK